MMSLTSEKAWGLGLRKCVTLKALSLRKLCLVREADLGVFEFSSFIHMFLSRGHNKEFREHLGTGTKYMVLGAKISKIFFN